jgi:transposase-like protein
VKVSGEPASRRWFGEDAKKKIVEETCFPGASISALARRYSVTVSLLFRSRQALGVTPVAEGRSFLSVKLANEVVVAAGDAPSERAPRHR